MTATPEVARGTARDRILAEAVELIEQDGIDRLTVRRIADRARVNVAAVNYYFGSRENLVRHALQILSERLHLVFLTLERSDIPHEERLEACLTSFCDVLERYPLVVRGLAGQLMGGRDLPPEFIRPIRDGYRRLAAFLQENGEAEDGESARTRVLRLVSAIVYPLLLGGHLPAIFGVDLQDPEVRQDYVASLAET